MIIDPTVPLAFPSDALEVGTRILVKSVDPFGYNGRENHPLASDRGRVGVICARETFPDLDEDDRPRTAVVYGVVLDTSSEFNDVRDLMDFEIVPV